MPRRRSPLRLCLYVLLFLVVALVLFLFFGVGPLARHLVEGKISDSLGVPLRLGKVKFSPVGGRVVIDDFLVAPVDGSQSPCRAKQAILDLHVMDSMTEEGWTVENLTLIEPDIAISINAQGVVDVGGLNPPREKKLGEETEESANQPPLFAVEELKIEKGRVRFRDARFSEGGFARNLDPVNLEVLNFQSRGGGTAFELTTFADDGEELILKGTLGLEPLVARANVELKSLPPGAYELLFAEFFGGGVESGTVSLKGDIDLAEGGSLNSITNGELVIEDLQIDEGGVEAAYFESLELAGFTLDVESKSLYAAEVSAFGSRLAVTRGVSGGFNLVALGPPSPAGGDETATSDQAPNGALSASETASAGDLGWSMDLDTLALPGAQIRYADAAFAPPYDLPVVASLHATDLHFGSGEMPQNSTLKLEGDLPDSGGRLVLDLRGPLCDGAGDGTILLEKLPTPLLGAPWLSSLPGIQFRDAAAGCNGRVVFSELFTSDPKLSVEGGLSLASLNLDLDGEPFVRCSNIAIDEVAYDLATQTYKLDQITVTGPEVFLSRDAAGSFNFSKIGGDPVEHIDGSESPEVPASDTLFELASLRVHRGRVHYKDTTTSPAPPFDVTLEELELGVADLRWGREKSFYFAGVGSVDHHAPLEVSGRYDAAVSPIYPDMDLIVKNLWARPLSPFSERYLGRALAGGAFSVKQYFRVTPNRLDGEVKFLFDHLEVGEKVESPDAIDVPLGLALFVMSKQGKVDEKIVIHGDPSDPNFELWPLFWKAMVNVVVKVAAMPITMAGDVAGEALGVAGNVVGVVPGLGGLTGGDSEPPTELPSLRFAPGSAELSPQVVAALEAIVPQLQGEGFLDLRLALARSVGDEAMDELAGRRVRAIRSYLVKRKGFRPHRVLGMRPGDLDENQDQPADPDRFLYRLERLDEKGSVLPFPVPGL